MKLSNRFLMPLLAFSLALGIYSCNNSPTTKEEPAKAPDTVAVAPPKAPEAAFSPFNVLIVKHTVADYAKWKLGYDAHDSIRKAYGLTNVDLERNIDNPKLLWVVHRIDDVQKAKEFIAMPNLKEAMQKSGVTSKPTFYFYHVIRDDTSKVDSKDILIVTHKVKDFNAWVKVYDDEGKAARAGEGLVDRVLARDLNDSNIVHLVFSVSDMAKAKASITSEAKKKIMMSAGVEGKPVIEFYKRAE